MAEELNTENDEKVETTQEKANAEAPKDVVKVDKGSEGTADEADVKENKGMAILAYLIFFIPLLAAKDSKFAMYHANQGLTLFLFVVIVNIVGTVIPIIGWLLILPLGLLCWLALLIIGILNASNGRMKQLPIIGKFKLIGG